MSDPFTYPPGHHVDQQSPDSALAAHYDQILAQKLQQQESLYRAELATREAHWNQQNNERRSREAAMEAQMQALSDQLKLLQAG